MDDKYLPTIPEPPIEPGAPVDAFALTDHTKKILSIIGSKHFCKHFTKLTIGEKTALAKKLALERGAYPLMDKTMSAVSMKRRGPRPKHASTFFLFKIRCILGNAGVTLPQWKKGAPSAGVLHQRTVLLDFCKELSSTTSGKMHLSSRSMNNIKTVRFNVLR